MFEVDSIKHSPIHNYIAPGITSWLISKPGEGNLVRMFEATREQQENVIPHSHRFNFYSYVLKGKVINEHWMVSSGPDFGDIYSVCTLQYNGKPGEYSITSEGVDRFYKCSKEYSTGEGYYMNAGDIHSIWFQKGTQLLIFEDPQFRNYFHILQPVVDGEVIPTFKVEDWMFK